MFDLVAVEEDRDRDERFGFGMPWRTKTLNTQREFRDGRSREDGLSGLVDKGSLNPEERLIAKVEEQQAEVVEVARHQRLAHVQGHLGAIPDETSRRVVALALAGESADYIADEVGISVHDVDLVLLEAAQVIRRAMSDQEPVAHRGDNGGNGGNGHKRSRKGKGAAVDPETFPIRAAEFAEYKDTRGRLVFSINPDGKVDLVSRSGDVMAQEKERKKKRDPSRPLPGQKELKPREVRRAFRGLDVATFDRFAWESDEIQLAVRYLRAQGREDMIARLRWMVERGLVRAGPVRELLATSIIKIDGEEAIILSSVEAVHAQSLEERVASIVHELYAWEGEDHKRNEKRDQEVILWLARRFEGVERIALIPEMLKHLDQISIQLELYQLLGDVLRRGFHNLQTAEQWNHVADALLLLRNIPLAVYVYRKVLENNPQNHHARKMLTAATPLIPRMPDQGLAGFAAMDRAALWRDLWVGGDWGAGRRAQSSYLWQKEGRFGKVIVEVGSGGFPMEFRRRWGQKVILIDIGAPEPTKWLNLSTVRLQGDIEHPERIEAIKDAARVLGRRAWRFNHLDELLIGQVDTLLLTQVLNYVDFMEVLRRIRPWLKPEANVLILNQANTPVNGKEANKVNTLAHPRRVRSNAQLLKGLEESGYVVEQIGGVAMDSGNDMFFLDDDRQQLHEFR
ncbi:MAG: hypothetical protein NUV91_02455, partial [Candidatus Omnitrophica bacterium]|nr:hypothetical protein [Candidatus Omnitrophota bacterium]